MNKHVLKSYYPFIFLLFYIELFYADGKRLDKKIDNFNF